MTQKTIVQVNNLKVKMGCSKQEKLVLATKMSFKLEKQMATCLLYTVRKSKLVLQFNIQLQPIVSRMKIKVLTIRTR